MLETGLEGCVDGVDAGGVEEGVDVGMVVVQTCVGVSRRNLALST